MKLFSQLISPFSKSYQHTFTYFFPAPKQSISEYREKSFDSILQSYLNKHELDIVSISTQAISTNQTSGLWIIVICSGKKEFLIDQEDNPQKVDGLYDLKEL